MYTKIELKKIYFLGDVIIQKGTEGNVFYVIKEGLVRVSDVGDGKTYLDHNLGQGEYFGERALITGTVSHDVII